MIPLPEPFANALREGRPRRVVETPAAAALSLYARALARLQVGNDDGAHQDLTAALEAGAEGELRSGVLVELELVAISRKRSDLQGAADRLAVLANDFAASSWVRARATHYLGLARGKLRQNEEARAFLLESRELYARAGDLAGRAQATDTLGTLYASEGRLDLAVSFYALSLVDKLLAGDRYGTALTLGSLGRAHLRAGRRAEALECFERNRRIVEEDGLGDERGRLRALEDEARTRMELPEAPEKVRAEAMLREVIAGARERDYRDLEFFARKDLALLLHALGRIDEAERELDAARAAKPPGGERYHELLLQHVQALLGIARGEEEGLALLEKVVRGFQHARLPDLEIAAREALARALASKERTAQAAEVLEEAIELARGDGFERLRVRLIEVFRELELQRGIADEPGRVVRKRGDRAPGGYDLLERLGAGAFGEVFKAFDPRRMQLVALKCLRLEELYDAEDRAAAIQTAKIELIATRGIFHPGIARVHAIGLDDEGCFYIVQDFVPGLPLSRLMATCEEADPEFALPILAKIARSLDAIHSAQPRVIHRDLKPDNVLLVQGTETRPVLVDFGFAYFPNDAAFRAKALPAGTPSYAAPEQMRGGNVSPAVDLYALGVIAYQWFAARHPLPWGRAESTASYLRRVEKEVPLPLAQQRPNLPRDLCARIDRLLATKPQRRGGSARELAEELEGFLAR